MKTFGKLVIGIILLAIGIYLAMNAGQRMAGGEGFGLTIPIGTIEVRVGGK